MNTGLMPNSQVSGPVVAVIQARMGSSRLPGKVLMPVAGKPLLWHIIHRLGQCRTVDAVAVATSTDPADDAIEAFCAKQGVTCVRGPLQNVLERYRLAAEKTGARTLLRITGDAPLIDPGLIDYLVKGLARAGGDFAQLEPGALCAHEGADVFSRHALDWLTAHAADDEIAREHVTSYFKRHADAVHTVYLPAYAPLARALPGRISVDETDDLEMLRTVYARLKAPPGEIKLAAVLQLLDDEPKLRAINAHVRQKPLTEVERQGAARRLGIGTVQFGQAYGVSNLRGQVPLPEARAILARAARAGVGLLDTAANYGAAEQVLAQADTSAFRIVTKTISVRQGVDAVIARARLSVATLGRVDLLLVHDVSDLRGPQGDDLWRALRGLKDEGGIGGIGISAYVADDPAALAKRFQPDAMQVPFSLLDQRLLRDGSLARLKDQGVEVHARSVFLQGLLFLEHPPENLKHAAPLLKAVRDKIIAAGTTPLAAALGFVLSQPEVAVAVTGVTALKELEEILTAAAAPLPDMDWSALALTDARLLTPSLW
jgi:spore coat polysaccharide biosynthesis protein SpsF (cytidylyltransferase family)/aryl-alcohol dehydrogenase-like predicted oxidoreductase